MLFFKGGRGVNTRRGGSKEERKDIFRAKGFQFWVLQGDWIKRSLQMNVAIRVRDLSPPNALL